MMKLKDYSLLALIGLSLLFIKCDCTETTTGSNPGEFTRVRAILPENDAEIKTQRVVLKWEFILAGMDFYDATLYIDTSVHSHLFQIPLAETDTVFVIDTLMPSIGYFWQVYMRTGSGGATMSHSIPRVFTISEDRLVFGEVHSPAPDSCSIGVGVNPVFSWDVYDPDSVGYNYDHYLGTTDNPPLRSSGLSELSYVLSLDTLEYATKYYWRVVALNSEDTVSGPLWEFTTEYSESSLIFASFEIDVQQTPAAYHVMEEIRARFDSALADTAVKPLQADSVKVEDVLLGWSSTDQDYSHIEFSMPFIENGQLLDISVFGNGDVPSLNTSIVFPACTLSIVSPESFDDVPISGFEVTWEGSECGGTVWLVLMDGDDSTGVCKETTNDGIDSLTAADLAPLGGQTGSYDLIVFKLLKENLDIPGYVSGSYIRARVINRMLQIDITSG